MEESQQEKVTASNIKEYTNPYLLKMLKGIPKYCNDNLQFGSKNLLQILINFKNTNALLNNHGYYSWFNTSSLCMVKITLC